MAKAIDVKDDASDKFGKFLPSEVTGLYLSVRALFITTNSDKMSGYILIAMALMCLAVCIFYIYFVRNVSNKLHIAIYAGTFVFWAISLDPDKISPLVNMWVPEDYVSRIIAALSLIWTFGISVIPSKFVSSVDGTSENATTSVVNTAPAQRSGATL